MIWTDMRQAQKPYDLAIDRARGRARREIVALIGGLLVLFNILAAGAFGASARTLTLSEPSADRIVICSGDGMIVVDRAGRPVDDRGRAGGKRACPFCLPLMQGHAKAPESGAAFPAPADRALATSRDHQVALLVAESRRCDARPRAPPVL
jgi:hypothetical protein